jgi:hypothetical protein
MQSTSATAISLLESGFDYRILGGKDRPSDTTTTLTAYIYAYYGGGSGTPSGDWRVVTGSGGASAWQPITNTSYAWLGPLTFTVTAEDPTTSYGVASSYDTLRFEVRSNSFATVYVSGWAVLE